MASGGQDAPRICTRQLLPGWLWRGPSVSRGRFLPRWEDDWVMTEVGISIWHPHWLVAAQALAPLWQQWLLALALALARSGCLLQVLLLVL